MKFADQIANLAKRFEDKSITKAYYLSEIGYIVESEKRRVEDLAKPYETTWINTAGDGVTKRHNTYAEAVQYLGGRKSAYGSPSFSKKIVEEGVFEVYTWVDDDKDSNTLVIRHHKV